MIQDSSSMQNTTAVDSEVVAAISMAIRLTLSQKEPLRRITFASAKGGDWNRADRYFRNPVGTDGQ